MINTYLNLRYTKRARIVKNVMEKYLTYNNDYIKNVHK